MTKIPTRYLRVDPWQVVEDGWHPERGCVSESIFSLGNEYMGVRGYFDEGYGGERMVGSYLNGVFDAVPIQHPVVLRGMVTTRQFMVNSVDWLHTRLRVDGEQLDLAVSTVRDFTRTLDLRTGTLTRSFVWQTQSGKSIKLTFQRFVSMAVHQLGGQRITMEALDAPAAVELLCGLDFSQPHHNIGMRNVWSCPRIGEADGTYAILGRTDTTGHRVCATFRLQTTAPLTPACVTDEKLVGARGTLTLQPGTPVTVDKLVVNHAVKNTTLPDDDAWTQGLALAAQYAALTYDDAWQAHCAFWSQVWEALDVTVDGDDENQQGVRFCIFQMHQTYHGEDATLNIGAKGLTGEGYEGATYWDTETYCLPFYMFNNPKAAKNLILYRYHTLPQALERAIEQDCRGACYPFATIDGTEINGVWQHGNLEIHVSAAISYAIWHYVTVTGDTELLYREGIEMLLQVCRFFATRGGWDPRTGQYGFFGVMGADEYHMMVSHNTYTNVMAQKTFTYTLAVLDEMRATAPDALQTAIAKVELDPAELGEWQRMAEQMCVLQDAATGVYEQHQGYFNLPHSDFSRETRFPLIKYWAYDRIYRTDMIKQPDVLLLHCFYSHDYDLENKRVNYEYYEPRCVHESSLSPSIHAILAAELGKHDDAYRFAHYATRLDLDDYNQNTHEGLHTTSMAAAWLNIVYGFGGLRTDKPLLTFCPSLPQQWQGFSFRIRYRTSIVQMAVTRDSVFLQVVAGPAVPVEVFDQPYTVDAAGLTLPMPIHRVGAAPVVCS